MIFISHSSKDKAAALDIEKRLLGYGYDASQLFLDSDAETGIPAGSKWEQVLYARLKDCRAFIVMCTANWEKSKWCFAELIFAKAMGKEIFPVLLEECSIDQVAAEHQAVFVYKDGEAAYSRLWEALDGRHLGPRDDFGWPPKEGDHCPFPGLPAFDERLAGVYFGRETETQSILEDLRKMRANGEPRLLMIVGASGSGKSSLLKAGTLPRLKHKTLDTDWVVLPTLRSGEGDSEQRTVFDQLAANVAALFPKESRNIPDWKDLRENLINDDAQQAVKSFVETLQDLTLSRNCPDATVVFPIDQFEELLRPSAGPMASKLLRFLKELLSCRNGRLLVIGTMRSDHLEIYERGSQALAAPYFCPWRLGPFPRERIEEVIRKPVKRASIEFTDELVERLKRDTPTVEALPLLAFTLEKLYRRYKDREKIGVQDYESLGGMEGSIQTCIDGVISSRPLSTSDTAALRLAFVKHLSQVSDKDEVVRLTARWDALPDAAKPILEKFVNEKLLTTSENREEGRSGQRWVSVEVAHEAMFSCWKDLEEWLRTSADILRWRRDVGRDQANDRNWKSLRPSQLAVARSWPIERQDELFKEEVHWIKTGILRERIRHGIIAAIVLLVSSLAGVAWWQRNDAVNATRAAQNALTVSFFRTIGVSSPGIPLRDEREALWELAQLDRANAAVRGNLLNRWVATEAAFMRGEAYDGQGFHAATGLNVEYHRLVANKAAEFGRGLAAALGNSQKTDSDLVSLAAFANEMESSAAREIANGLAAALENPQVTEGQVAGLGNALAALADKMEPSAAAAVANGLAAALENPQIANPSQLSSLASTLAALADKMDPQAAAEIANGLVAVLENSQEKKLYELFILGKAVAALANKMGQPLAAEIARRDAQRLVPILENPPVGVDPAQVRELSDTLVGLASKMEPHAAAEIANGLAAALKNPQETNPFRIWSLGNALAAFADKMDPQAAVAIATGGAQRLAAALRNPRETNPALLSDLSDALARLVNKIEPQTAAELARRGVQPLAAALEDPQVGVDQPWSPAAALAALADKMEPQARADITKDLFVILENPQETNLSRLSRVSIALAALANKMQPQAAAEIAKGLAAALENLQETNSFQLWSLGIALAALADKLEPQAKAELARRGAHRLAAALEKESDFGQLWQLGTVLAAFCKLMPSTHQTHLLALSNMLLLQAPKELADPRLQTYYSSLLTEMCAQLPTENLTEVLKYPFCTGEAQLIVLNQLKAITGRDFDGNVWKFVEEADALGIKDVDSPAQRPLAQDALKELDAL